MSLPDAITPNGVILKEWRNWVLVATVLFLTGVVFHLVASKMMGVDNKAEQ